jgi:hypothetical protein
MKVEEFEDKRYLLNHSESDSLFEVFIGSEARTCLINGCDDVTDEPRWEELFKKEQLEKQQPELLDLMR